jgi:hypothetical protein
MAEYETTRKGRSNNRKPTNITSKSCEHSQIAPPVETSLDATLPGDPLCINNHIAGEFSMIVCFPKIGPIGRFDIVLIFVGYRLS